jgi:hypothetical protein
VLVINTSLYFPSIGIILVTIVFWSFSDVILADLVLTYLFMWMFLVVYSTLILLSLSKVIINPQSSSPPYWGVYIILLNHNVFKVM